MTSRKLIAIDLDGTLFYPKKRVTLVSRANREFLRWAHRQGHELVFVTSRNYPFVKKVVKLLNLPINIVARNGTEVYFQDALIDQHVIQPQYVQEVVGHILEHYPRMMMSIDTHTDSNLVFATGKVWYLTLFYRIYYFFQGNYREPFLQNNRLFLEKIKHTKPNIQRLLIFFGLSQKAKKIAFKERQRVQSMFPDVTALWIHSLLEISPENVNKANGIRQLLQHLHIAEDDVYVVGDSGNDVPMFEAFKHSFVMKHAHPFIKAKATHHIRRVHDLKKYL